MSVKLEAGQWWRNREGFIRYVVGRGPLCGDPKQDLYPFLVLHDQNGSNSSWSTEEGLSIDENAEDLVEHLPCCDGFNWVPSVPPDGYRNLCGGETIVPGVLYLDRYWKELPSNSDSIGKEWNAEQFHPMAVKKFQLRKGAWYEREDGIVVGPLKPRDPAFHGGHTWACGGWLYDDNGVNGITNKRLIKEAEPRIKEYRPFSSKEEAMANCDGWWIDENGNAVKVFRVNSSGVFIQGRRFVDFNDALGVFKRPNGNPFGMIK